MAKIMIGLLKPQEGHVFLDGRDIKSYTFPEIRARLGFVSQEPKQMNFNLTVDNEIAFGLKWRKRGYVKIKTLVGNQLHYYSLSPYTDENSFNLSKGQKQMVAISAIMALSPIFLILDEPTKNIDTYLKGKLQKNLLNIATHGTGIILISHDTDFLSSFEGRNFRLNNGIVAPC